MLSQTQRSSRRSEEQALKHTRPPQNMARLARSPQSGSRHTHTHRAATEQGLSHTFCRADSAVHVATTEHGPSHISPKWAPKDTSSPHRTSSCHTRRQLSSCRRRVDTHVLHGVGADTRRVNAHTSSHTHSRVGADTHCHRTTRPVAHCLRSRRCRPCSPVCQTCSPEESTGTHTVTAPHGPSRTFSPGKAPTRV